MAQNVFSKVSTAVKKAALKSAIVLISNTSNKNWARLARLAENLTYGQSAKDAAKGFRKLVEMDHPSIGLVRRVLNDTNRNCRKKFITNLIVNGLLMSQEKKAEATSKDEAVPATVLISPTMRCNLSCVGCYAGNYSKADDMTVETLDRIIREGKEMGVSFFVFLGGEPLFYPEIFDIVKKHSDVYFQCYTNGTMIDEKVADKLIEVGNILPIISIEGFEKETDERRGQGVYKKVMQAMDILKKKKIPFGFSTAVTNKNVDLISSDEFIDFMIEKGAFIGWFFLYMPIGKDPDLNLMPTPEQRHMLLERVAHIRDTKPLFIVDFWNDAPFVGGCIAAKEYIHITSKGDVEPCIFSHFAVDNIKDKSLKQVMNSDFFKALRHKQPYNSNLYLPCMWIDNPEVSREIINKYHAYSTHGGADDILVKEDLKKGIDAYSAKVKSVYVEAWEKWPHKK
ncbi:MAG: radical SAM protein [Patescibacteria group bacterium]